MHKLTQRFSVALRLSFGPSGPVAPAIAAFAAALSLPGVTAPFLICAEPTLCFGTSCDAA
jgi:hypothetical protein